MPSLNRRIGEIFFTLARNERRGNRELSDLPVLGLVLKEDVDRIELSARERPMESADQVIVNARVS